MTDLDRLASRGSHALFWLVLGAQESAEAELVQLSEAERTELFESAELLCSMLQELNGQQ